MKKVKIELKEYYYTCGDGCCTEYGTITVINDKELEIRNQDTSTIIKQILTELGYDVEITETYEN